MITPSGQEIMFGIILERLEQAEETAMATGLYPFQTEIYFSVIFELVILITK